MSGFTKLFSSITESSLWSESKDVRILWVAMLAKADANGFVEAAVPGLARVANLTMPETQAALESLMSPDPYSKNPDNDGRRVEQVRGGFLILNYNLYRDARNEDERREYMREYMRQRRAKTAAETDPVNNSVNNVNSCKLLLAEVSHSKPQLAQAEAEAEAEADKDVGKTKAAGAAPASKRQVIADADFVAELAANPAYQQINVAQELAKMQSWCRVNHKHPTRRRLVNWLNRVEKPMQNIQPIQQQQKPTVWTLKQQEAAVLEQKLNLEKKYGMETPHGLTWAQDTPEHMKAEYKHYIQRLKAIRAQIANGN